MNKLIECPFCGSQPVFRKIEEEYHVFCNGCFITGDAHGSEKVAADAWNHRVNPWRDITSAPKDGTAVDLWINGYRVTNCQWDESSEKWMMGWLDDQGKFQSFGIMWGPPSYWMSIPEPPKRKAGVS
jgi:Lar family restriction alleviation protein